MANLWTCQCASPTIDRIGSPEFDDNSVSSASGWSTIHRRCAEYAHDGSATNLTAFFIGERADGSVVTQFLNLTATATNFPLTGFTDIVSLRWNTNLQGITVIDNVIVRTTDWEYAGLNFGSMANPATLSGKVYYDTNKNGAQDAGENGIFNR